MNEQSKRITGKPFFKRPGAALLLTGIVMMVVFGLFILADSNLATPIWIGVLLGFGMAAYGLFRALKGPGMLDDMEHRSGQEPQ